MARVLLTSVLLLSIMSCYSANALEADYCACEDGLSNASLEDSFDLACNLVVDCVAFFKNQTCYDLMNPKSRCDYAVNLYYQITGICNFTGFENTSHTAPEIPIACVPQSIVGPVPSGRGKLAPPATGNNKTSPDTPPKTAAAATALVGNLNIIPLLFCLSTGGLL